MAKLKSNKRNNASSASSPYAKAQATTNNVFKFSKDFGQHILKNPGVAQAIVDKAYLKPSDTGTGEVNYLVPIFSAADLSATRSYKSNITFLVLEVGPGTGNLTARILEKAKKVIAVELDPRMAAEVTKRFQTTALRNNLQILLGDVIKTELPPFDVCISNTPYQISSPLVFKLLSLPNPPRISVLMFQREFALRLTARPGDSLYCRLSVNAQFWAKITHIMKVGKNNFKPPPKVESSVVRIEPKMGSERPSVSWDEWDGMLRICFVRRSRTMRASWLGSKEILSMVERNYRVFCAMNNIALDDSVIGEEEEDEMEVDGGADEWNGIEEGDEMDDDTPAFFKEEAEKTARENGGKTKSKKKKTRVAELVREKIRKVLEDVTELADKRAGKCDENDFLRLLAAFNDEGIHFA
ncbi:putative rRNA (Adenine-N6,N6-)-dimethyltransferase [Venustampulla echinocandica]|uniref:rRNA adenine N(6)-methyltransferase n=1 Tax=Venustampulla echinocandica TaxID=2656787 RepID=A0A370TPV9_9HELO|nr:putative rRNA (Adenine-N6,N6-)-dimethyltransferase [Venustampulla echinocandica]RDL37548.1 putative rRNA (Adenine-N6,N6-)-dimethyltransferase [Venustampulla echinocandica]